MPPALKVCGVTRRVDLRACERLGVDAVGINLWSGSKRGLTVDEAKRLLDGSRAIARVGVFVDHDPAEVARLARELKLDAIQPHAGAPSEPFAALGLPWVWVIRGTPELSTLAVPKPAPTWVLLDAAVPGFGGAGAKTDWTWAATAVRALAPMPVWLAGGITADNAADALALVRPAGLDVASGSEAVGAARGEKDVSRIEALLGAVRAASDAAW